MDRKQKRLERFPEVLGRVGLRRTSVYEKIKEGSFPKPIRISSRAIAWDSEAIDKWIEKQIGEGK